MTTGSSAATDSADRAALPEVTLVALLFGSTAPCSWRRCSAGRASACSQSRRSDSRDYPIVQAVVLCLSAMYIGINLLVDVLYAYLNPKIRYSS